MSSSIEAAFLDIDGTLVDSNEFHVLAWHEAFERAQVPVAIEQIRKQIGKGADMLIPALAPGLSNDQRTAIAKGHDETFKTKFRDRVRPFPRAGDLIQALARDGVKVALASSAGQAEVDHYVKLLDVKHLLTATTSSSDVKHSKPAGDIFATALHAVAPALAVRSIAVGDTPYDVESSGKSQIRCIALRSGGFSDAELESSGPISIYDDVGDLLSNYMNSIFARGE
jgi:phosphoglycolate phosphatase-like HAD superfamily hydrolase